jgi:hypothetical protein
MADYIGGGSGFTDGRDFSLVLTSKTNGNERESAWTRATYAL